MKLNWVTIKVSNLEESMKYYTELLGLKVAARFGSPEHQIAMLGEESLPKVELVYEPANKIENPGKGVSIGLEADDLDGLVNTLKQNGRNVTGPISPNPNIRFFFTEDPDGYTVQLIESK